jgi:hypothetical protein
MIVGWEGGVKEIVYIQCDWAWRNKYISKHKTIQAIIFAMQRGLDKLRCQKKAFTWGLRITSLVEIVEVTRMCLISLEGPF